MNQDHIDRLLLCSSGELPEEERRKLDQTLAQDPGQRAFLRDLEALSEAARAVPTLTPSRDVLRAAFHQWKPEPARKTFVLPALVWRFAAAAAGLALGALVYLQVRHATQEAALPQPSRHEGAELRLVMAKDRMASLLPAAQSQTSQRIRGLRHRISLLQANPRLRSESN